jgi:hypothetical protein
MQPFDLSALAAERRVAREREAWCERFRRRSKAAEPTRETTRPAPGLKQAPVASPSRSGR